MSRGGWKVRPELGVPAYVCTLRVLCAYSTYPPTLHVKVQLEYTWSTCGVPYSTTEFRVRREYVKSTSTNPLAVHAEYRTPLPSSEYVKSTRRVQGHDVLRVYFTCTPSALLTYSLQVFRS